MGLYINNGKHGGIYKNDGKINEPNQSYYKRDHFAELVNGQLKVNESLKYSIHGLKILYEQQENYQDNKWKEISNSLNELKEFDLKHEKDNGHIVERLKNLESESKKLQVIVENERLSEQQMKDQINSLNQSNLEIVDHLEEHNLENKELKKKMSDQFEMQKHMQKNSQNEVLGRLEKQEALTEKIVRQIDFFRSVLFERTNYLAEKIEDGYQHTSSYITKLMTGSELTSTNFMTNKKQKEDQKVHK